MLSIDLYQKKKKRKRNRRWFQFSTELLNFSKLQLWCYNPFFFFCHYLIWWKKFNFGFFFPAYFCNWVFIISFFVSFFFFDIILINIYIIIIIIIIFLFTICIVLFYCRFSIWYLFFRLNNFWVFFFVD